MAVDGVPLRREVVGEVDLGEARGGAGGSADRMDSRCGPVVWRSEGVAGAKCREASVPSVLDHLDLGNEPAGGELVLLQGGQGGQSSLGNMVAGNHARPWTIVIYIFSIKCLRATLVRYQAVLVSQATSDRCRKSALELWVTIGYFDFYLGL